MGISQSSRKVVSFLFLELGMVVKGFLNFSRISCLAAEKSWIESFREFAKSKFVGRY